MNKPAAVLMALMIAGVAVTGCSHEDNSKAQVSELTDSNMQAGLLPKPSEGLTPAKMRVIKPN